MWRDRATRERAGSLSGYTLIELLVVVGVITSLAVIGFPNLLGGNERFNLDNSANKIRQVLIEAKTRSLAPTRSQEGGVTQIYQINIGPFPSNATEGEKVAALGSSSTNTIRLSSGSASCGTGVLQSSLNELRKLKLSRNVYVSRFYPTNQAAGDTEAAIRFSVGKVGFYCGSTANPDIDSSNFDETYWMGSTPSKDSTQAQYLVVELSSRKVAEKRYVVVDRLNSEIIVSRTDPQQAFTTIKDTFAPLWKGAASDAKVTISCGTDRSKIQIAFQRAVDAKSGTDTIATADSRRLVFYDIYWTQGSLTDYQPIASKYFYDLTKDLVQFTFLTDALTVGNQPSPLKFRIWAFDAFGNYTNEFSLEFKKPDHWDCSAESGLPAFNPSISGSDEDEAGAADSFDQTDNPGVRDTNSVGSSGQDDSSAALSDEANPDQEL